MALNKGERDFIEDLVAYLATKPSLLDSCEMYLLRNQSRKGIGFFEAGNFYPDFILWLLRNDKQYVTFLDPKGIRNLEGADDPKISFFENIKHLERTLGDPGIVLNSFIIANTAHADVAYWQDQHGILLTLAMFAERHVYFQNDDKAQYIQKILTQIIADSDQPAPSLQPLSCGWEKPSSPRPGMGEGCRRNGGVRDPHPPTPVVQCPAEAANGEHLP